MMTTMIPLIEGALALMVRPRHGQQDIASNRHVGKQGQPAADVDGARWPRLLLTLSLKLHFLHMAGYDGEKDYSWIEKVRSGGAVPYLEPENCSNGWATPTSDNFMVRGPNYLSDKIKIRGGDYLLEPLGFDWIKGPAKVSEILRNANHRVRRAVDDEIERGNRPFVWAFNLQLPTKDNYSAVMYFVALEPIQDGTLMDKFLKGDDSFRNSRLKLIANIVQGPWIVRTAVGEQAICILGRALSCKYTSGLNYMEVDVDIGSSIIANAIVHLAFSYVTTLTVDLAFLIESQTEEELPEQILGAVRFSNLNPVSAGICDLTSDVDAVSLPPLLPTRLWRSIGFGFTSLPSQGSLEPYANGNLHGEDDAKKDENWFSLKPRVEHA
ncbi:hypothetical protein ZIOFF_015967 [Zingiber officinale]|uniref:Protein ENHANCED DISEASE RESISTANCE 2 C-terminal domain-containing protein n=2 Tax=Zingiber officinale TaxID=94328 RepID=A0A8J5I146_ZINOF|nr:hypothetical protein ZIOFF_015967 [Zingiber officinale]